jgi:uncharacterized membrane protein
MNGIEHGREQGLVAGRDDEHGASRARRGSRKRIARFVLAAFMLGVGALHFVTPEPFMRIVPRALPAPLLLVYVSGFFEMLGGAGILIERTRRIAGLGLVALYIAVFPANINMAVNDIQPPNMHIPEPLLWLRLPLQLALIWWAWSCTRPAKARKVGDVTTGD